MVCESMSVVNTLALIGCIPHPYKISSLGQYTSIHSLKVLRRGHHSNVGPSSTDPTTDPVQGHSNQSRDLGILVDACLGAYVYTVLDLRIVGDVKPSSTVVVFSSLSTKDYTFPFSLGLPQFRDL